MGGTAIKRRGGSLGRVRFEELYRAHGEEALRLAYVLTRDRALSEDVAQEAFVRLLGRFQDLRNPDAFRAYLLRTVVNITRSHFRRLRRERAHGSAESGRQTEEPVDVGSRDELWDALRRLPERQRTALVLRYCQDLSEQQAADVMGASAKAVKSLIGRGLARLRSQQGVSL